jgi:hypothetical protein
LVHVHQVLEREAGAWAQCSLVGADVARQKEIPTWMLDASTCRTMRRSAEPVAALSALVALRALLNDPRGPGAARLRFVQGEAGLVAAPPSRVIPPGQAP